MMITKAQVELVKTLKYSNEPVTEALSALIAVGERLAEGTHYLQKHGNPCRRFPYCGCGPGLGVDLVCHDSAMIAAAK